MEPWLAPLQDGDPDVAWDAFLERYRRLVFATIRHHVTEPDDVMDVFARVCEALRADGLARLQRYPHGNGTRAQFSTWLVAVVRNQTIDWLRHRDGRRPRRTPAGLTPVQQRIYQRVFLEGASHRDCFHLLTAAEGLALTSHEYAVALAATYRIVSPALPSPRRRSLQLDGMDLPADPAAFDGDTSSRLDALLEALSGADRLALRLYVVDELSAADVARIVGWPSAKTVYNRVGRALRTIRAQLADAGLDRDDV